MFSLSSDDQQSSKVADFYTGKTIFITGAAGFIGSVLLETLLSCCPGIVTIYILLRSKKNVEPEFRKEQIFNKKIFEKIKEENPELLDKVRVISGDVSLPSLGMNEDDKQLLIKEVSVVIHCAAIISFTKPLKYVLLQNVSSVKSVIDLCRKMRKFEVLVYTSTAYSNSNHAKFTLKEEVYRLPFRAEKFLDALKDEDDEKLLELCAHCKPDWPNSYVFSKCLAENVIMDTASDLPIAIIRPAAVICTWKRPMPGYAEEKSGMVALTIGAGKGFIKVLYADLNLKTSMVPADVVANAHVLAAWSVGTKRCISPFIVHCTAPEKLRYKLSEYIKILTKVSQKFPVPQSFEEQSDLIVVSYKPLYFIAAAYHHYLPAIVLDGILRILGKKPRIVSLYRFYDTVMKSMNFFMFHAFDMDINNFIYLDNLIHPEEKEDFGLDFGDASVLETAMKLPEVCAFYNWKIDKKSPSERQKAKYRRHILIKCIQGIFIVISCLLIYWLLTLIFR